MKELAKVFLEPDESVDKHVVRFKTARTKCDTRANIRERLHATNTTWLTVVIKEAFCRIKIY